MGQAARAEILIVEDNAETRDVLQRVLIMQGYEVTIARNGAEALEYLEADALPSAIILDLAMPVMDGITFSQKLRAVPRWANIPVIVYTAMPMKRVPAADGVFRKGTDNPNRLFEMLAAVCRKH